eukprot:TRINITY_DN8125_c0_g2_i1.p1 TRINITY_DN8125_c0_g2~~TRINITY_DN8125_c0_g2_i1.p1  ORF type:complete len:514 (+),score=138.29 TRINITY_DN8125_c0_g2_i1:75-1544(+)
MPDVQMSLQSDDGTSGHHSRGDKKVYRDRLLNYVCFFNQRTEGLRHYYSWKLAGKRGPHGVMPPPSPCVNVSKRDWIRRLGLWRNHLHNYVDTPCPQTIDRINQQDGLLEALFQQDLRASTLATCRRKKRFEKRGSRRTVHLPADTSKRRRLEVPEELAPEAPARNLLCRAFGSCPLPPADEEADANEDSDGAYADEDSLFSVHVSTASCETALSDDPMDAAVCDSSDSEGDEEDVDPLVWLSERLGDVPEPRTITVVGDTDMREPETGFKRKRSSLSDTEVPPPHAARGRSPRVAPAKRSRSCSSDSSISSGSSSSDSSDSSDSSSDSSSVSHGGADAQQRRASRPPVLPNFGSIAELERCHVQRRGAVASTESQQRRLLLCAANRSRRDVQRVASERARVVAPAAVAAAAVVAKLAVQDTTGPLLARAKEMIAEMLAAQNAAVAKCDWDTAHEKRQQRVELTELVTEAEKDPLFRKRVRFATPCGRQ